VIIKGDNMKIKKIKDRQLFSSIKNKLVVILIIACIVPVILQGAFSYSKTKKIISKNFENTTAATITEVNRGIENYFQAMSSSVNFMSSNTDFKQILLHPEYEIFMKSIISEVKESNDGIQAVYFATVNKDMYIYPSATFDKDFDPSARSWYKGAMDNKGKLFYSDPFKDAVSKKTVVAISKTVEFDGKVIGVVAMNINLEVLSEKLSKIKIGKKGYVYITDKNGIMVAHPDNSILGTDTATKVAIWDKAKNSDSGMENYVYNNSAKIGVYDTNELTGWKLFVSMPEEELTLDLNNIRDFTGIFVVITFFVSIFIAIGISKIITKNIKVLQNAFSKASSGDLSVRSAIKSKDEFGTLGKNFDEMMNDISALIINVKNSAHIITKTSDTIALMATESNTAINEVALTIDQVATGTSEQSSSIEEGVRELEILADKIEKISNLTHSMQETSKNTDIQSKNGLNIVGILTEKSKVTAKASLEVNDIVLDVDKSSNEIGTITDTINQIAAQTNLLALNAAIEAARAGEAGRGFSVVADEIRKLAEQSTEATNEIQKLIDTIKNRSQSAVKAMETTKNVIEEQDKVVVQTRDTFDNILESVNELIAQIERVRIETNETTSNKDEVIAKMENISAVSEETAASTEEVSASTEEITATMDEFTANANSLKEISVELQNQISKFKF
jgi:methyl-accepting chemotaxis protein